MKFICQMQSLVPLTLRQFIYRNACPSADDTCDFLIGNSLMHKRSLILAGLSRLLSLLQLLLKSRELSILKLSGLLIIAVSLGYCNL